MVLGWLAFLGFVALVLVGFIFAPRTSVVIMGSILGLALHIKLLPDNLLIIPVLTILVTFFVVILIVSVLWDYVNFKPSIKIFMEKWKE